MKKSPSWTFIFCAGLTLICGFLLSGFGASDTFSDTLRVHIVANSNTPADQSVKLAIRDEVILPFLKTLSGDVQADVELSKSHIEELTAAADEILKNRGFSYSSTATVGIKEFGRSEYAGIIYPAGAYPGIILTLGEGAGQNWWCVVFPEFSLFSAPTTGEPKSLFAELFR